MICSVEQVKAIRQGKMTAMLVLPSDRVQAGRVQPLRRRVVTTEGSSSEPVMDTLPDGERTAVVMTIIRVDDVEVATLTLRDARACAFRTSTDLRTSWTNDHPRAVRAQLVRFQLGDLRDRPRLVSAGWPDYTSDPGRAMRGEPEAVSQDQLAGLSAGAQQRWLAGRAQLAARLATRSPSERLEAIERAAWPRERPA